MSIFQVSVLRSLRNNLQKQFFSTWTTNLKLLLNTADILTQEKKTELFGTFQVLMWRNKKTQKLIGKNWKASLKTQIYSVVIIKLYELNLVFDSKSYIICYKAQSKYKFFLTNLNWKQVQKFK